MKYYAYYALYRDDDMWDDIEKIIKADSLYEAWELAKKLSDGIKAEYSARASDSDWWVNLEEVVTEDEI